MAVKWWLLVASVGALSSAGGHAFAGGKMFYRPMRATLPDRAHQAVLGNVWHTVTIHFAISAVALLMSGLGWGDRLLALAIGVQFGSYAVLALGLSMRLGGVGRLPQWMLFAVIALLATVGVASPPRDPP